MQINLMLNVWFQKETLLLLFFLMLHAFEICICFVLLHYMKGKYDSSQMSTNATNSTAHVGSTFYSPLLSTYIYFFTIENIHYQVEIPEQIAKKLEKNLSTIEKEDILFLLSTLFQTAFAMLKKSNIKTFFFEIAFVDSYFTIHISHSFEQKKFRRFYIKQAFGKRIQFKKIQSTIKQSNRIQLSTEVMENQIQHKLTVNQKS